MFVHTHLGPNPLDKTLSIQDKSLVHKIPPMKDKNPLERAKFLWSMLKHEETPEEKNTTHAI